jgi:hypothetical protein
MLRRSMARGVDHDARHHIESRAREAVFHRDNR